MPDYTIKNMYDQGKYEDAIAYAKDAAVRDNFTEWDYFYLSMCMYKLKHYAECLELYKEFHQKFPESDKLDDNMGWSLYHENLRNFDYEHGDRERFIKQVDYILSHTTDSQYSPKTWVARYAANAVFKKHLGDNPNYELGNRYLSYINPLNLDTAEGEANVEGRKMRMASERERWYNYKTKALYKLELYNECLEYIDEAFRTVVGRFHNNGDHWLNYRKALCLFYLGDVDGAEKTINGVLKKFKHWCFYELLFNIAVTKGDFDAAIRYGATGALVDREHKLRVTFYKNYADFLMQNGYQREADLHYRLIECIRTEEEWKALKLPPEHSYPPDILNMDKKNVLKELNAFWKEEKERGMKFYEGTIERVLPNGKSGFIRDDETGDSYYFNVRDFTKKVKTLHEGARVRYARDERFDKSKNKNCLNAVELSFVKW